MGINRYAKRVDSTQVEIVAALRKAGIQVWVISKPVDILTLHAGRWLPLEIKSDTSSARNRKDQDKQKAFLALTGVPIVKTPQEAITAITARS